MEIWSHTYLLSPQLQEKQAPLTSQKEYYVHKNKVQKDECDSLFHSPINHTSSQPTVIDAHA
jgi:hypothetical protein